MSALRYSVPGQPTRLIDQGPATGRTTHTRSGIRGSIGGALVTPMPRAPKFHDREKEAAARRGREWYAKNKEKVMEAQRQYRARKRAA